MISAFSMELTLQLLSASRGDASRVQQLLDSGVAFDAASAGGFTALQAACMSGQQEVVELLLELLLQQQGHGSSNLEHCLVRCIVAAALMGHASIIRFIASQYDVRQLDLRPWQVLHAAASGDNAAETLQALLQCCSLAVDHYSRGGWTPLHTAAFMGCPKSAKLLLRAGADVHATSAVELHTPLHLAAAEGPSSSHSASRVKVVQLLLDAGADVAATDKDMHAPLHMAANEGQLDAALLLLQHGAAVNAADVNRSTPLHVAAAWGRVQFVQLLISAGADLEAANWAGFTPLLLAASEQYPGGGHQEVACCLVRLGADVRAATGNGQTALHFASYIPHHELLQLLLQKGALLSSGNSNGFTPLHEAAAGGHVGIVQQLLRYGADISAATPEGCTALTAALEWGHSEVTQLLLSSGAPLSAAELFTAVHHGTVDDVLLILSAMGDAADRSMLVSACHKAADAHFWDKLVVLAKQLYLLDASAVQDVFACASYPAAAAAACVARCVADTRSIMDDRQAVSQQRQDVYVERQAVQQLVLAAAGMLAVRDEQQQLDAGDQQQQSLRRQQRQ